VPCAARRTTDKTHTVTLGGPVHDAARHILRPDGTTISLPYAAGEMGSVFGHLYMSCGNIAE
jgi:hypothetical protein